jgi:hypothetical protein
MEVTMKALLKISAVLALLLIPAPAAQAQVAFSFSFGAPPPPPRISRAGAARNRVSVGRRLLVSTKRAVVLA